MKKIYNRLVIHCWFQLMWMICLALPLRAQLSTPPVIQGQQIIEGGIDLSSRARLAKASTGDYGVLNGTEVSYLNPAGTLKSVAAVEGSIQINISPVEYTKVLSTVGLAPTSDGGFVMLAVDATNLYIIKKDANQNRVWSTILTSLANQANTESYGGIALVTTTDGNYMAFARHTMTGFLTNVTAFKFNSAGAILWSRDIFSPLISPVGGCPNVLGYDKVVASPDGSFLLTGGQFCQFTRPNPNQAIAAKIDGEAHPIWTRTYSSFVAFSDQIANPYEAGTFLVLTTTDPNFTGSFNGPTYPGKLQADGTVVGLGNYTAVGRSTIASDGSGQPYFVIQEPTFQNGGDFKLTGVNQAYVPVWTKTLGGSLADTPQAILTTGDGYMVAGTTTSTDGDVKGKQGNTLATWVVKLTKIATPLVMTAPTYNCQTGAFTFNTSGGDGTTIEYQAAGLTDWTTNPNQMVDHDSRTAADVQPFLLKARQSGTVVTYTWNLRATCNQTPTPKPPVFRGPIPDQSYTVGQQLTGFIVGNYFSDPTTGVPNYAPDWRVDVTGLPDGLYTFYRPTDMLYSPVPPITILGTPTTTGVYTVTVTARTAAFSSSPIVATFRITVSPGTPPGNPLTLLAPLYNCATGAFTFQTSGGDGSPIEYQAAGLTDWTTNPNQQVDHDSRTAADVQPFLLKARQSGTVVTYTWNLRATCNQTPTPKPPVLRMPIPDMTFTVGQNVSFSFGPYFGDPTTGVPNYIPFWSVNTSGLPPGLQLTIVSSILMFGTDGAFVLGSPTTPGVYNVTVVAGTEFSSPPVTTTFKITVLPVTGTALTLLAPTYDCATGAFTFHTSGGDGSPIEYQAAGLTDWTTNPNQQVDHDSRTAADVQPFLLKARQSGIVVTYTWNLKAACGRARLAAAEPGTGLTVRVLGNPILSQTADLEITGVEGQKLQLNLVDSQGRSLHQQTIGQAGTLEQLHIPIGQARGLFLLQINTSSEHQSIKLLKP